MALNKTKVKLMELADIKVAKLLTDSTTAPTYATSTDLAGALKLQVSPKTENKKLYGDSVLQDIYSKTTEIELNVEIAYCNLDALPVILGGTVAAVSGSTPNQTQTYSLKGANSIPPYFKIEGQWTYAGEGLGDAHVILYKCKVTDPPDIEVNDANGNFGTVKFKAIAVACQSNDSWFDITINETKTSIS